MPLQATLRNELPVLMIMGNKSDRSLNRVVSREEGQRLALVRSTSLLMCHIHLVLNSHPQELSALFSEASALSGDNVLRSQATLGNLLLERQNTEIDKIRRSMLQLHKSDGKKCHC